MSTTGSWNHPATKATMLPSVRFIVAEPNKTWLKVKKNYDRYAKFIFIDVISSLRDINVSHE